MVRMFWGILLVAVAALPASAGARDFFTEFEKDFGTSARGSQLQHYFWVTNNTKQVVHLGQARVSCGCVAATVLQNVLQPGQSTAVRAMMDTRRIPHANVLKEVIVYVPFHGPIMEEVMLKVRTITRDDLVMTPDKQEFGTVKQGKEAKSTVKVTLFNHPQFAINEVVASGKFLKPELKLIDQTPTTTTYEVTTTLDNKCAVGNWASEVWLKTNTPGIERIMIPIAVNVVHPISVTPGSVNFNDLAVGKESQTRILLTGTQAFKVLQVKGVDDILSVKASSEESRPVHTLTITITPKESGDLTKSLEILTDNKDMPSLSIPITAMVPKK